MASISIKNIAKSFGVHRALDDVSLEISDGELIALLGPSGCGKTTLLRIVAGLESENSGDVLIGDRNMAGLPPRARGLAMVFQNYAIFPHMTVAENIAFGLRMQKKTEIFIKQQTSKVADLLHIAAYLERYPAKLSGGQRQRVAVARALAVEPAVLLMDEPLSNLDALLRLEMRTELKSVLRAVGTTTVYVTHDQTEAMGLADRIAVMHGGKIDHVGSPIEIYSRPKTRFVGSFIGNPPMNFIACEARDSVAQIAGRSLRAPCASGKLELGLRAEDATIGPAETGKMLCDVEVVEPMGSHLLVTGKIAGQLVRLIAPSMASITPKSTISVDIDEARISWFDPETGKAMNR